MNRIEINGKQFFIEAPKRFEWLLEEKLGRDAAQYFRDALDEVRFDQDECDGECNRIYQLQEHYERILRDADEALGEVEGKKTDAKKLQEVYQILRSGEGAKAFVPRDEVLETVARAVKEMKAARTPDRIDASAFARALHLLEGLL